MYIKRVLVILSIVIIVAIVAYIVIVKLAFSGLTNGLIVKHEEIVKSSLGDEFLFKYEDRNFPDSERVVNIMDSTGKYLITFFVTSDKSTRLDLLTVIDSANVRCYEIDGKLVYKVDNSNFKGVDIDAIEKLEPNEYPALVAVARDLIAKKEWKWVEACGNFLLKAGDDDTKQMIERYAKGDFTQDELELNKNGEITKEEMRIFAEHLLQKK